MKSAIDRKPIRCLDALFKKGGLGDSVARLPAIKYILKNNPHIQSMRLFVQDYFKQFAIHCINDPRLTVFGYSQMNAELEARPSERAVVTDSEVHTTLKTHLTDHAFHTLVDIVPEIEDCNYLQIRPEEIDITKFNLPEKYLVVTTGFTAANREWLPGIINDVINWSNSEGMLIVFLGKTESPFWGDAVTQGWFRPEIQFDAGISLVDQTSLLEAAKIMGEAQAVVGLDNGLLHLAASTDVPIVASYTTVSHKHRAPYRHNKLAHNMVILEPPKELACRLCQTQLSFVYEFDFRTCYYNTFNCLTSITSTQYIEGIKHAITNKPRPIDDMPPGPATTN